jgi:hypothetical protein
MTTATWISCGKMTLCEKGRPKFPEVGTVPGLYRLTLDDGWHYIGETADLAHRLGEYRNPTTGVISEHRINQALKNAGGAMVEIFTGEHLSAKDTRCLIETSEILRARIEGKKVLNGGHGGQAYCLLLDIAYHEKQIEKLRKKLDALPQEEE